MVILLRSPAPEARGKKTLNIRDNNKQREILFITTP
jgi:hypothetical protein